MRQLHDLPRPLRLALYGLASGILLLMCNLPQRDLPHEPVNDKLEHMTAWFVLTAVGYLLAPQRTWAIAAYAAAFGALIEILQAILPFGRDAELGDWLADLGGVGVALVALLAIRRVTRARKAV